MLEQLLRTHIEPLPFVADIRGRGLFWGIEFSLDTKAKVPFPPSDKFCSSVVEVALDLGLNILGNLGQTGEYYVDHVIIAPPYIVQEQDLGEIVDLLREAIEQVALSYIEKRPLAKGEQARM